MRVPKPTILAGPIADESEAWVAMFDASLEPVGDGIKRWTGYNKHVRRSKRGFYVIERNPACTHVANKRIRRRWAARRKEMEMEDQ